MENYTVGAGILSVITESLYDNPIVIFREYVQNSADSIMKSEYDNDQCEIRIWEKDECLYFLDNACGIEQNSFNEEMVKIGASSKKRQTSLGYKGIGRLSGVPYCEKIKFINIIDYASGVVQIFTIDSVRYNEIKDSEEYSALSFEELMTKIGNHQEDNLDSLKDIAFELHDHREMFKITNTGFLVVLENISSVLKNIISSEDFVSNLQWLLPVDFESELYGSDYGELFTDLTASQDTDTFNIKYFNIYYNDNKIFRPIKVSMLRGYVCKSNFKYAVGFHTFPKDKISIDKNNCFKGIRIYIDNMLLCDESELLRSLDNYGLLSHTFNGLIQTVRGIGAMIYITDKVNITANARRTFIEVTDNDSLEFLRLLAEFINTVYDTRYALSNFASAQDKQVQNNEKLQELRDNALNCLRKLTKEEVELSCEPEPIPFEKLDVSQKKRVIKRVISTQFDLRLKEYLKKVTPTDEKTAWKDFLLWLNSNE